MKKTIALLTASAALGLATCLPARSAMQDDRTADGALTAEFRPEHGSLRLWFVDDDDDDHRKHPRKSHDDDDDDDNDDGGRGGRMNPAPAGAAVPPHNGLFGNGAKPQVQIN
ncbi:hypothetical protein AUC68_01045 [Methyloceanibacter methanicus]|uniref:Lipoprotein n=1 Tax=Methyloceanibacter methanicus TaxID=1774968 RepID=A0A1E3W388_9HYPH|nr:hypothetical protein [Methyloceanibacter methanicus]ODS00266.1 hypothetical protein AUC68_01045 [Methyloceanibacter methanicus]